MGSTTSFRNSTSTSAPSLAAVIVDDMDVTFGALTNKKAVQEAAYRTRRGQATVVQAGRSSGRIPYGYEKVLRRDEVNGMRRIVLEKAEIVVRLFEETASRP